MVHSSVVVARILPDREIQSLLGTVISGGAPECVRVNSYEVRLGHAAKFDSTGEEVSIPDGHYLEIEPGDLSRWKALKHSISPNRRSKLLGNHTVFSHG